MARKRRSPAPVATPAPIAIGGAAEITVRITAPNVWSNRGKHYQGDTVVLPTFAAQALIARGQAKEI